MFMVVAIEDKKEPLRQRLGRLLRGAALEWEDRSCGGNRYRYIVWHGPAERLPWNRLALLCPRPRSPVLLPPEVLAPEGCPLRDYRPQDFTARLTVAAARQAMEQTAGKGSGLLGLLDPQGIAPWACGEWLDCCRGVKVYTLRRSRYAAAETMLRVEYGLPLLWAETPAELEDCSICAAPYPTGVIRVRRPIITADRSGIQGNPTVNRLTLALTPERLAEVPPGAEPTAFWGMVTECGTRRVKLPLTLGGCRIDGRLAEFTELGKLMRT